MLLNPGNLAVLTTILRAQYGFYAVALTSLLGGHQPTEAGNYDNSQNELKMCLEWTADLKQ